MLKEIQSNVFRTNGKNGPIRPKIVLNKGLNVVNGSVSGTNSIGKSTFLMVIDFCLGGKDYYEKLKPVKDNIGDHEINFAFEFKNEMFYFCRNTGNPDIIHICDSSYNKTGETWSKNDYVKWLNEKYSNPTMLSFRELVSLYLRIYNRENLNETLPLRSFNDQKESQSIENILKLFDLFGPIIDSSVKAKEASDKKSAFSDAQKYEFIPKINKTKYNENLKRIKELEDSKIELAEKSEKGLLELTSTQADQIRDLKNELSVYRRQRGKLFSQLDTLKKDKVDNKESLSQDFEELKNYFPELQIQKLAEVESFHKDISSIMTAQIKESEKKIWNLINLLNGQIKELEDKILEISQVKHVSKITLDKYSGIDKEIDKLKLENEKFDNLNELTEDCKTKENQLLDDTMIQAKKLENRLNSKMADVNSVIFGSNTNTPEFHITSPKRYTFFTPNDDGTGTNYKGLVVMDIATLLETALPLLVHDSVVLKQISNESIEKIFELYNQSEKQIFVSIDKDTSYTERTTEIIHDCEVLKLSSGGNELFGFAFGIKE